MRIFHNLPRFSENLSFTLLKSNSDFKFSSFFSIVKDQLCAYGLEPSLEEKNKTAPSTTHTAFVRFSTRQLFSLVSDYQNDLKSIAASDVIEIKMEIDTVPCPDAEIEIKQLLSPAISSIKLHKISSLMSENIHALLHQEQEFEKIGKALFDYVFFLGYSTKINLEYLSAKLKHSAIVQDDDRLTTEKVKKLLIERFQQIDYEEAAKGVAFYQGQLSFWSADFFISVTEDYFAKKMK